MVAQLESWGFCPVGWAAWLWRAGLVGAEVDSRAESRLDSSLGLLLCCCPPPIDFSQ
ncbi:hypothetical protein [Helicobacter canis]|uniref:hypothetical protein n=1 Tax=Helicobacter canis TaxID=29419 RepID=UPI001B3447FF|nr:hypothetical protein [Helicobacter canis]